MDKDSVIRNNGIFSVKTEKVWKEYKEMDIMKYSAYNDDTLRNYVIALADPIIGQKQERTALLY